MAWNDDDVERWLTDWPLPQDFTWKGETVWPRYQLKHGYGQWLRTAGPYHPALRGLFGLIAAIIKAIPAGHPMPTPEQLQAELKAYETVQETLGVDDEPAAEIGRGMAKAAADREALTTPLAESWPEDTQS